MEGKAEMLTVSQLIQRMNISRAGAYKLVHAVGFPMCRVGKKILIPSDRLKEWIDKGGTANERCKHC